jgi:ketohexokinase
LADDAGSEFIRADLAQQMINMDAVQEVAGGRTPTSYVTLSSQNGSRSIVHFRDLPEYSLAAFQQIDLSTFDWLHFEGRNVEQTRAMLDFARQQAPNVPRSVEIEKPREGIASLCEAADLLLYSRHFAQSVSEECGDVPDPVNFLQTQQRLTPTAEHICSWGEQGAWGIDRQGEVLYSPAIEVSRVVDTLGAGDTFNAAIIHAKLAGRSLAECLNDACQLAGKKCAQQGLLGLL